MWGTQRSNKQSWITAPAGRLTTRCWRCGQREGHGQVECCTGLCCTTCWTNWERCTWDRQQRSWRQSTAFCEFPTPAKCIKKLMKPSTVLLRTASKHSNEHGAITKAVSFHSNQHHWTLYLSSCQPLAELSGQTTESNGSNGGEEWTPVWFCTALYF